MEILLGTAVSLVVEVTKKYFGTDTLGTMLAVAVLSLFASTVYTLYSDTVWYQTAIQIAITAGAFHNFIIKRF